ncbi:MAG: elongation factor 4 [Candidatus Eisenbacteria bacterium]|nr:elongation factor 4 [Candidatus Latescibacterota bacterium]MBD3301028.1 elongation factor 4 [Candidatus Eisenbacteria bacterium]
MPRARVRNFCIIAHIDHGKSTLADRLLETTETLTKKQMREQVLDALDLERERGITIKAHAITMYYLADDGEVYQINLIDTPGHVDFSYEVSRSLAACEGALLLVDASQGIEAQTLSNLYMALDHDLSILTALNKIDLPNARVDEVRGELRDLLGQKEEEILLTSAKEGIGIREILETVVREVPPPRGREDAPLRALIFDSAFDLYRGVLAYVRVVDGALRRGESVRLLSTGKQYEVLEVGHFQLRLVAQDALHAGDVGYVIAGIKEVADAKVGDTVAHVGTEVAPLPGYKPMKPMVYSGLFPVDADDYLRLKEALGKLQLNDAALVYEPETSLALGFGFRAGFLGPLHLEIVAERLRREYDIDLIATTPNVPYLVLREDGTKEEIDSPAELPRSSEMEAIQEPFVVAMVITPTDHVGNVMKLCQDKRGEFQEMHYLDTSRARLTYRMPLAELIYDFYDRLKSTSRGYATLDYEFYDYVDSKLVKLDVLLNGDPVDALSIIVHEEKAYERGRELVDRLRELIPRQMFKIAIQAAVGSRVIARSTLSAVRKDVLAKCYGGDVTRKRKLLERQREGKRKMKQIGTVQIPQEAFLAILKSGE